MICDNAAEYVSALCDGELIPREAAEHINSCVVCRERMRDYVEQGVELRRTASLDLAEAVAPRAWSRPQNRLATWWHKGWGRMHIPRLVFASMFLVIMGLAASLLVGKVRAHSNGTVVLLSTIGPSGQIGDCPLSTQEKNQACSWFGNVGSHHLAYKVGVVSRDGDRVQLAIRTRIYSPGENLSAFTLDTDPVADVKQVWFEPGEPSKIEVSGVGTLTLTGEWLDHMPMLGAMRKMDHLEPGPNEVRFASPLVLKDKTVVCDLKGAIGGIFSTDDRDWANAIYIPGEGRFLIAQVPMKGAVEAHVEIGRISFEEGGHSWVIVNGVPVSREHLWVLHEPDFSGQDRDGFGNQKLIQNKPGVWEPEDTAK